MVTQISLVFTSVTLVGRDRPARRGCRQSARPAAAQLGGGQAGHPVHLRERGARCRLQADDHTAVLRGRAASCPAAAARSPARPAAPAREDEPPAARAGCPPGRPARRGRVRRLPGRWQRRHDRPVPHRGASRPSTGVTSDRHEERSQQGQDERDHRRPDQRARRTGEEQHRDEGEQRDQRSRTSAARAGGDHLGEQRGHRGLSGPAAPASRARSSTRRRPRRRRPAP